MYYWTYCTMWCTSVCWYFYGTFRWMISELLMLDRKTRKVLQQTKSHHARASLERLYLPRAEGGRQLQQLKLSWEKEVLSVVMYLLRSQDQQVHTRCAQATTETGWIWYLQPCKRNTGDSGKIRNGSRKFLVGNRAQRGSRHDTTSQESICKPEGRAVPEAEGEANEKTYTYAWGLLHWNTNGGDLIRKPPTNGWWRGNSQHRHRE